MTTPVDPLAGILMPYTVPFEVKQIHGWADIPTTYRNGGGSTAHRLAPGTYNLQIIARGIVNAEVNISDNKGLTNYISTGKGANATDQRRSTMGTITVTNNDVTDIRVWTAGADPTEIGIVVTVVLYPLPLYRS